MVKASTKFGRGKQVNSLSELVEMVSNLLFELNTSSGDLLERERGEKRRLAAEVESLKRRLADVCERA